MALNDENDFRSGDMETTLLRKILARLGQLVGFGPSGGGGPGGDVTLTVSDIEIGAVELKDATTDTRAKITAGAPAGGDNGIVVRNIPSGTQDVSVTNFPATQPVSGPLTDAQLRASAVPVSAASLPLPSGASTEATLALIKAKTDNLDVALSTRTKSADTQAVSAVSLPLPTGASTEATLATRLADATFTGRINTQGQKTMAASTPVVIASDQSAISVSAAALPLPSGAATEATLATRLADATFTGRINTQGQKTMAASTPVVLASDQSALAITAAALPLPSGAATEATLATRLADATFTGRINTQGQKTMAASTPVVLASDQASIPVTGPLTDTQLRASAVPISAATLPLPTGAAQEHTTAASPNSTRLSDGAAFYDAAKTGQLPSALVGGRLDANIGAWLGSTVPTVGSKVSASSIPVVVASDQGAIPVSQSGTWTVQPGNTANTTPWLVSSKTDLTPSAPTAASVGVASAQALASNASRKGLTMVNTSNNRISLGFGSAAVLDSGTTLFPGDAFIMDQFSFDLGAVNAIASGASSNLAIQEYA